MTPAGPASATLLTPAGAGAVGLIRVSGPDSIAIVSTLFRQARDPLPLSATPRGRLRYGTLVEDGEVLDDVVVAILHDCAVPVVDIAAHGGVRVLERILLALRRSGVALGLPDATPDPSEISNQHVGIDAEVMALLPAAATARAVRLLARQYQRLAARWRDIADLIDDAHTAEAERALSELLRTARGGVRLVRGATVVLIGPPNSGKSTLLNRLAGREAAIVSDVPGTTRDWISQAVDLRGVAITLVDTAGQHDTVDPLEQAAIARVDALVATADARIRLVDGSAPTTKDCDASAPSSTELLVVTKADLPAAWSVTSRTSRELYNSVHVSAVTGAGIESLGDALLALLGIEVGMEKGWCLFTTRQIGIVTAALSDLGHRPAEAADRLRRGAG